MGKAGQAEAVLGRSGLGPGFAAESWALPRGDGLSLCTQRCKNNRQPQTAPGGSKPRNT